MVERYDVDVEQNENGYWEGVLCKDVGGPYVRHSDYAALEAELAEAGAELARLREGLQEVVGSFDAAYVEGLPEALAEQTDTDLRSLHDLVTRRLLPAHATAIAAIVGEQ